MACALAVTFAAQPAARAQQRKSSWGQILIAGGRERNSDDDTIDNSVDLYDPASNRFAPEIATSQLKERMRATATLLVTGPNAGKVLLAGGDNRNGVPRTSTELYDPATNTVVDGPAMKIPRSGHTATAIPSGPNAGKILLAGGNGADAGELPSTELYDPAANRFSPGPAMRAACSVCTAMVITSGKNAGKILIVGSYDSRGQTALVELYDPGVNQFIAGLRTNMGHFYSATPISSGKNAGKVLIVGGSDATNQKVVALTGLYDPEANTFSSGPSVKNIGEHHTTTVITSGPQVGKILIAGGGNWIGDSTTVASTELYDPGSNAFSPGPSMNTPRAGHTATVVLSGKNAGRILIAGGVKTQGTRPVVKLSSTELYDPLTNTFAPGPKMNWDRADAVAVQLPPAP
jgi:hypothetical protein